ncbi:MAG TPA: diguanylate cyclase [Burkholderiaceae bacterium]|nr:diguanylate cyclase [Burkholderiaceae bacterium]
MTAKVLLIEDDPPNAWMIRDMLALAKSMTFEVSWAESLEAGVKQLNGGNGADVVLLDLGLPGSYGLETLQRLIAAVKKLPPVVVLSGIADEDVAVQAVQAGAQDYLVKGNLDPGLLARSIRYAMERSEAEAKYRSIFENAIEGIFRATPDGRFVTANPAFARMFGCESPQELMTEIGGVNPHHIPPAQWQKFRNRLQRDGAVQDFVTQVERRDGSLIWLSLNARAVWEDDDLRYFDGTATDITDRRLAEDNARRLIREEAARQEAETAREKLKTWVEELERRNREMARMGEMIGLLQTCAGVDDFRAVVAHQLPRLFEGDSGALYLFDEETRERLSTATAWGAMPPGLEHFAPEDCWALRRNRPHFVESGSGSLVCRHVDQQGAAYACVPLVAQGEALGTLHVRPAAAPSAKGARRPFLQTVAENLALGLANVRLREALRSQAIRDPLTGLYNRRFMEETIGYEVRLAARRGTPLALIMADVDHFKQLNDTFGHATGDRVLRELADTVRRRIRRSDLACRYGGEELLVILPDTSLDAAARIAEALRSAVREMGVQASGRPVGRVTISLGVAAYPVHGENMAAVLRAADAALYRAKSGGRDRVVVAEASAENGAPPEPRATAERRRRRGRPRQSDVGGADH